MSLIPTAEIVKSRQKAAILHAPAYEKSEFDLMLQAVVDELLKAATFNGLKDKMNAAIPGHTPTAEEYDTIIQLGFQEAARQVNTGTNC